MLASESGEIPHIVADAGRTVPEDDDDAWVAALGELIATLGLRAALRERGLKRVRTTFAWPAIGRPSSSSLSSSRSGSEAPAL